MCTNHSSLVYLTSTSLPGLQCNNQTLSFHFGEEGFHVNIVRYISMFFFAVSES